MSRSEVFIAPPHLKYRRDIDGLRAVAVFSVVLFHGRVSGFSGGFVGVDIFFVISGFLITSIILPEIDAGSFSLVTFYQRRVRRIFPALAAVVTTTIFVGYLVLTPSDFKRLGESIVSASLFVSNFFFWKQVSYFAAPASESPLLHTWSLSVEEQFYLLYPLVLIGLSRIGRPARSFTIAALFLGSLIVSCVMVGYKPSATFFLGPTRAWELLIGGMIAAGLVPQARQSVVLIVSVIGAALICFSIVRLSSSIPYPGVAATLPVFGTAMVLWGGTYNRTPVHRALSTRPFVSIGRASYSFYLWHFPLFAFWEYVALAKPDLPHTAVIVAIALALAYLTLYLLENPFRFGVSKTAAPKFAMLAASAMAVLCISGVLIRTENGIPSRMDSVSTEYLAAEGDKERHHQECMSVGQRIVPPSQACNLGTTGTSPHVLLWGDSHAMVTATAMEAAAKRNGRSFLFAADADCPIGLGFSIDSHGPEFVSSPAYRYCEDYDAEMLAVAKRPEIDTVVLSSRWTKWSDGESGSLSEGRVDIRLHDDEGTASSLENNEPKFERGFRKLIAELIAARKTVWIVGPLPEAETRIPKALYVEHLGFVSRDLSTSHSIFLERNAKIFSIFQKLARQFPVKFIWPHEVICGEAKCAVVDGAQPLYLDDNHLSVFGALKTSSLYDKVFNAIITGGTAVKGPDHLLSGSRS